jgi:hypothetical protein
MRIAAAAVLCAACSTAGVDPPDASPRPDAAVADALVFPDARPPDAMPDAAPDPAPRYTTDRVHSPINGSVVASLEAIVARGPGLSADVFSKVGDSITVAPQFLTCFAGTAADLGGFTDELAGTHGHFQLGVVGGTDPYRRESKAASVGKSADWAITAPDAGVAPLTVEVDEARPRYAIVMFGSNDVASRSIQTFGASMLEIVDQLAASGVIPLLSTIPPNDQTPERSALVPRFNAVVRGIAQARQVPLMDLHREMLPLADHGLTSDNLHPNAFPDGACKLTPEGLSYGYNTRNLLALQALDRARAVVEGDPPPEEPGPAAVVGAGSYDAPFVIGALPYTDLHDTSQSPHMQIASYPGCNASQNEGGAEYVYRLTIASAITVRAIVVAAPGVDVDVHLMRGLTGADCVARNDRELVAELMPGTYHFILDTFVPADGRPRSGEYLFVLLDEG